MSAPSMQSPVPSQTPKAYPAAISSGSPGMKAMTICSTIIPTKAMRPQMPCVFTQARNFSGSSIKRSSGPRTLLWKKWVLTTKLSLWGAQQHATMPKSTSMVWL